MAKSEVPQMGWVDRILVLPLARLIFGVVFLLLGPLRVRGKRNVPKRGGLLILANHISDADPVALQLACPRAIRFMGKSELFEMPSIAWLLRLHGAFPVKRGEPDRAALKHAVELLKRGEAVGVFPEGQLSETGELQEIKPGIALIARMAKVPVICCSIANTDRMIPYGSTVPRPTFHSTPVRWGKVLAYDESMDAEAFVAWVNDQLHELAAPRTRK